MAIKQARSSESERLGKHLQILSEDDPTFHVSTHEETGRTTYSGMGELHLEVIRERLRTEFDLETTVGAPEIAYRETILATAQADHLLKKQNGGVGMYSTSHSLRATESIGCRSPSRESGVGWKHTRPVHLRR